MKHEPQFFWDEETGTARCVISNGYSTFEGVAHCAEQDQDMKSEKTGCEIAAQRVLIKYLTHIRDYELKPQLKSLLQLYNVMKHSSNFNENSYENKMLQRQIRMIETDLDTIKEEIATAKQNLREYITQKDKFYKDTRRRREQAKNS